MKTLFFASLFVLTVNVNAAPKGAEKKKTIELFSKFEGDYSSYTDEYLKGVRINALTESSDGALQVVLGNVDNKLNGVGAGISSGQPPVREIINCSLNEDDMPECNLENNRKYVATSLTEEGMVNTYISIFYRDDKEVKRTMYRNTSIVRGYSKVTTDDDGYERTSLSTQQKYNSWSSSACAGKNNASMSCTISRNECTVYPTNRGVRFSGCSHTVIKKPLFKYEGTDSETIVELENIKD